jgi:hypothetical protein
MADYSTDTEMKQPFDPVDSRFREDEIDSVVRESVAVGQVPGDGCLEIGRLAKNVLQYLACMGMEEGQDLCSDNLRTVKLRNGQVLFVCCDTYRDPAGYTKVEVLDSSTSDLAILSAMSVAAARPVEYKELHETIQSLDALLTSCTRQDSRRKDAIFDDLTTPGSPLQGSHPLRTALRYVIALLRHYRPEFDDLDLRDQLRLAEAAWARMNTFLEALSGLESFLRYGTPDQKLTSVVRNPQRDVRAAVLHDVEGMSYREVGERLKVPLPPDYEIKGEHQTVRKMVGRGRSILETAFGEEGWRKRIEAMKVEKKRWELLSPEERRKEVATHAITLEFTWTFEEVRQLVDENPGLAESVAETPQLTRAIVDTWYRHIGHRRYPYLEDK